MPKAKGRRSKKQTAASKSSAIDIQVLILIFTSIILAVLIYTRAGAIGETLAPILGGIIGWVKYIIPIGTGLMAIHLISEKSREPITKRLIKYSVLIVAISVIITVYHVQTGTLDLSEGFEQVMSSSYELGAENIGGGAVRSSICYAAYKPTWNSKYSNSSRMCCGCDVSIAIWI